MPAVSTRSGFGSSHSISGLIAVEPQSARNRPGTDERSIPRDESDRLPDQAGFARCRAQESRRPESTDPVRESVVGHGAAAPGLRCARTG